MTVLAKDAEPGKIYRLTRDSGTTYYKICDRPATARLEKRLAKQSPRLMKPDDRFALQALERCKANGHVLAMRILRFREDSGAPRESRAYVAFPPDYVLREVERPPGYAAPSGRRKNDRNIPVQNDLDTGRAKTEDFTVRGKEPHEP